MTYSLQLALLVTVATMGCYRTNQRERPGDADVVDARASDARTPDPCRFSYLSLSGASVDCTIATGSLTACADAARCICAATAPDDVEMCVQWETQPRAQITFSDFCEPSLPARMPLDQALRAYLESRGETGTISSGCASIPALLP